MGSPVRIIGVGNPLMGDDGVGIAVAERLAGSTLPEGIEVVDGGTGGLTLLSLMEGAAAVVLVDAVDMGCRAGEMTRFSGQDLLPSVAEGPVLSLHAAGLGEVLALGREMDLLPPVSLVAIQPARVAPGLGLSPPLAAVVGEAAAAALAAAVAVQRSA